MLRPPAAVGRAPRRRRGDPRGAPLPARRAAARVARDAGRHGDRRDRDAVTCRSPRPCRDPRQEAIAATVEELERLGVTRVTILVAGGLRRRPSPREIGLLVPPEFRRRFRGRLIVHDAEDDDARRARRRRRAAAARLPRARRDGPRRHGHRGRDGAARRPRRRSLGASSTRGAAGLGRHFAARDVVVAGLDDSRSSSSACSPRAFRSTASRSCSTCRTSSAATRTRSRPSSGSRAPRRGARSALLPAAVRLAIVERVPRELHGRGGARRHAVDGAHRGAPARDRVQGSDARRAARRVVIGIPPTTPFLPRELPEPGLGRLPRARAGAAALANAFPVKPGGTAILLHDFARRFPAPTQIPYRALFADQRTARDSDALR